MSRPLTDLINK